MEAGQHIQAESLLRGTVLPEQGFMVPRRSTVILPVLLILMPEFIILIFKLFVKRFVGKTIC